MKLIYKYIVLIIIIFIIIYKCSQKSINIEHLDEENNVYLDEGNIDTLKFNMDKFLEKLTEDDAKKMLVTNNVYYPWVKFMEVDEANKLYNKLFKVENYISNENSTIGEILENEGLLDNNIKNIIINNKEIFNKDTELYEAIDNPNKSQDYLNKYTSLYNTVEEFINNKTKENITKYGILFEFKYNKDNNLIKPTKDIIINIINNKKLEMTDFYPSTHEIETYQLKIQDSEKLKKEIDNYENDSNNIILDNIPNELKYRVFNNRIYVANVIANIINSIAIKNKWNWGRNNVKGVAILNNTVNPSLVLLMKKSKLNRIINMNMNNINRQIQSLGNTLTFEKEREVYTTLLDISSTVYNSDDKVIKDEFINSDGQIIYSKTDEDLINKIQIIINHNKIENIYQSNSKNFIKGNVEFPQDVLGLPLFVYDYSPEPLNNIMIARGEINKNTNEIINKNNSELSNLKDGHIIYRNDTNEILLKIIDNNGEKQYLDRNNAQIMTNNEIIWAVDELKKKWNESSDNDIRFDIVVINNILLSLFNNAIDNFKLNNNDNLGLPIKFRDPYPYKWPSNMSHREYTEGDLNIKIILKKMKIDNNNKIVETNTNYGSLLDNDEVIVGPNNNIILQIINGKYVNGIGIEYLPIIDINKEIDWKNSALKQKFEKSINNDIKYEIALINKLIVSRANIIKKEKNSKLPYESRNKVGLVIKNVEGLTNNQKNIIYSEIADSLSNYNIIMSASNPEITAEQVSNMNRLNLSSIFENGIQNVERLLIKNICIARISYPDGTYLLNEKNENINFFYISDVLRLQKAIFGLFNNTIEPEDGVPDILYAGYRIKLMLEFFNDTFILDKINNINEKEEIESLINKIKNDINFKINNIDINIEIYDNITSKGLTLDKLSKIYKYINLNEYLNIKLDINKTQDYYDNIFKEIDINIKTIRNSFISEKSKIPTDEQILEIYNYKNARNAINEYKERLFLMKNNKKLIILNQMKNNIFKRQLNSNIDNNELQELINKNVTLYTSFYDLRRYHLDIGIFNNISSDMNDNIIENFNIKGYETDNFFYIK